LCWACREWEDFKFSVQRAGFSVQGPSGYPLSAQVRGQTQDQTIFHGEIEPSVRGRHAVKDGGGVQFVFGKRFPRFSRDGMEKSALSAFPGGEERACSPCSFSALLNRGTPYLFLRFIEEIGKWWERPHPCGCYLCWACWGWKLRPSLPGHAWRRVQVFAFA
jgi:hypothetical protein